MKIWLGLLCCVLAVGADAQEQACPVNISFSAGSITNWSAYTGNNANGNGESAIKKRYLNTVAAPSGTINAVSIAEYGKSYPPGILVNTSQGVDPFGGFAIVPTVNGYRYGSSVRLGSTAVSFGSNGGAAGGYIRGISYTISVPAGSTSDPYTMTYAYAMVLENGTHNSDEQPLFSATLSIGSKVVACASPKYYLPTSNTVDPGERGALLDTATAIANGFHLSSVRSPNGTPSITGLVSYLQDVWTKSWTEVTFDLSPYRGKQVVLTFEADNCIPGGHFAYAYIALRNSCAGLEISGPSNACINTQQTYSVPALAGASYQWTVPAGWTILSGSDSSILQVQVGPLGGQIVAHEINGCADLRDTLPIVTSPPTIPGAVDGDTTVCTGINLTRLLITGNRGGILKWIASTDGATWTDISNTSLQYTAVNLTASTHFRALVQNGESCLVDTAQAAFVQVDQRSVGGSLDPPLTNICKGQDPSVVLNLIDARGVPAAWQSSTDGMSWVNLGFGVGDSSVQITGINTPASYRAIVKNGVCPADTSALASVKLFDALYPQASIYPADTTICYDGTASLHAKIDIGTSYTWTPQDALVSDGNGRVSATPYPVSAEATPKTSTVYVLSILNDGCPNALNDSFDVHVRAQIIVNAGHDTSVVINQQIQLLAVSSEPGDQFRWTPETALSDPSIPNPVAVYDASVDSVRYLVTATAPDGCQGSATVGVKVFKTGPDIFVPNAFTPGKVVNAVFRPIPVGIATLQYFRIFNRWGQLVFSTTRAGEGWDGNFNGQPQPEGSFVWMVQGISYTGNVIAKKGAMVLIR